MEFDRPDALSSSNQQKDTDALFFFTTREGEGCHSLLRQLTDASIPACSLSFCLSVLVTILGGPGTSVSILDFIGAKDVGDDVLLEL